MLKSNSFSDSQEQKTKKGCLAFVRLEIVLVSRMSSFVSRIQLPNVN